MSIVQIKLCTKDVQQGRTKSPSVFKTHKKIQQAEYLIVHVIVKCHTYGCRSFDNTPWSISPLGVHSANKRAIRDFFPVSYVSQR